MLQVHPDKCSCFGAAGAFHLLDQAAKKLLEQGGTAKAEIPLGEDDSFADDPTADWTIPNAFGKRQSSPSPAPPSGFMSPVRLTPWLRPADRQGTAERLTCLQDKEEDSWLHDCDIEVSGAAYDTCTSALAYASPDSTLGMSRSCARR